MYIKINDNDTAGYNASPDRMGDAACEVLMFESAVNSPREAETGRSTGRRQWIPIKVVTRVDQTTPLIMKALVKNEKVDCVFKFWRPDPTGSGTFEQHYTIELKNARIASHVVRNETPLASGTEKALSHDFLQTVTFVFEEIKETFVPSGAEHIDSLRS
jgi:type VI secretion system secreted protein Hcp